MDKKDFIAKKMKILMGEGKYNKAQAFAIANSYAEKEYAQQGVQAFLETGIPYDPNYVMPTTFKQNIQNPQFSLPSLPSTEPKGNYIDINNNEPMVNDMSVFTSPEQRQRMYENKVVNTNANNYDENGNAIDTNLQQPVYNTRYNIANPYGGYSPELMAMKSGQLFGSGNPILGTLAGAGSLSGFGRNFMTGFAASKENNRVRNEYFDNAFSEKPNYSYYQQGGEGKLNLEELLTNGGGSTGNLMGEIADIRKTDSGYRIIYDTQEGQKTELVKNNAFKEMGNLPELRRYYFKRGQIQDPSLVDSPEKIELLKKGWQSSGYNPSQVTYPESVELYMQAVGRKLQQGGKITNAEFLTGQYATDEERGNVNVEGGEYLNRQGNVQEVVGEPHIKNGKKADGVDVNLQNGDKVLSNYTKIPAKNIKELKERYNLSLKKGATFADAQKAFDKKLGIKKVTEELSDYIEQFGKNESVKDETTKRLNASVLAKEIEEYKGKLEELKQPQSMFFDNLFSIQESLPKIGGGKQLLDKNGKPIEEESEDVSQQGGQQDQIQQLYQAVAQMLQQGVPPEQIAQELINQGVPQEVVGQIIQEVANQLQGQSPQEEQMEGQMSNEQEETNEEVMMAQQGFSFSTKYTPKIIGYDVEGNAILETDKLNDVELMQPYTGKGYGAKMSDVQKTIDLHKWYFDTDEKKKAFIEASKKEGEQPEIRAFQEAYNEEIKKRAKSAGVPDSEIEGVIKDIGFTGSGVQQFDGKFGAFTSSRPLFNFSKKDGEVKVDIKEPVPTDFEKKPQVPTDRAQTVTPWLPQALRLPPSSLDPLAKEQVSLPRLEPIKLTTEPMLAEQERQRQTDVSRIQSSGLTPQQQEALLASGLSASQMASNDAIAKVEMANQQNQYQVDQFNAGQIAKEDITNAQFRQDYQNKVLGSLNAYERDLRNFYTEDYLDRAQKFKDIENLNLLNAKNDQYQYVPGQGVVFLGNRSVDYSTPKLNNAIEGLTAEEQNIFKEEFTKTGDYNKAFVKAKQKYGM